MTTATALRLEVRWDGERIRAVAMCNPALPAAADLVGCSVDEVLELVAASCSECRRAQEHAARAACIAAGAIGIERGEDWAAERAIAAETAQEHLSRLMLDWPALFGHASKRERFANLSRRLARPSDSRAAYDLGGDLLDLIAVELLGGFFRAIREPQGLGEFVERARSGGSIGEALADLIEMGSSTAQEDAVPLLPALSAPAWARTLGGVPTAHFCATPDLAGRPHETGALARHASSLLVRTLLARGHRVAARLFARAIDLADCASRLRHPLADDMPVLIDAAPLGEGSGIACVETARGVLLHAVRLADRRVVEYAIVTPTAWNFHPDGAFVREATGWSVLTCEAALLRLRALALALDPCVEFEIELLGPDDA